MIRERRYDFLIVGAGPFGAAFAATANAAGKRCLLIDRKPHLGGAVHTRKLDSGVHYGTYGPHVFHTFDREQWDWVNSFGRMNGYTVRTKAKAGGNLYSFPINLLTLHQIDPQIKTPEDARRYFQEVTCRSDKCCPEDSIRSWCTRTIGWDLYQRFVYGYTVKQWGRRPEDLPASIIQRLPVRLDFNDNYFRSPYQGFPEDGWLSLIANMLDGSSLALGEDYFARKDHWDSMARQTVYSGLLEQFFDYEFGKLPYRSLRFEDITAPKVVQGNAVINHCDESTPYTRVTEHRYFTGVEPEISVATREYPEEYDGRNEPFYPIETQENKDLHDRYRRLADGLKGGRYIFGGRLTMYRYYDLRHVFGQAKALAEKACGVRETVA